MKTILTTCITILSRTWDTLKHGVFEAVINTVMATVIILFESVGITEYAFKQASNIIHGRPCRKYEWETDSPLSE